MSAGKPESKGSPTQENAGRNVRAAMRDYIESLTLNFYFWPRITRPSADGSADELAIQDEDVFLSRFGFDAQLEARRQVIEFKRQTGLTDREIRLVKRAGALRVSDTGIEPRPSELLVFVGWAEILIIAPIGIAAIVALLWKAPQDAVTIAKLVGLALGAYIAVALTYSCHVKANRLLMPTATRISLRNRPADEQSDRHSHAPTADASK